MLDLTIALATTLSSTLHDDTLHFQLLHHEASERRVNDPKTFPPC